MARFNPQKALAETEHKAQYQGNPIMGESAYVQEARQAELEPTHIQTALSYTNAHVRPRKAYSGPYASPFLYIRSKRQQQKGI